MSERPVKDLALIALGMLVVTTGCGGEATGDVRGAGAEPEGVAYSVVRGDRAQAFPPGTIVARFDLLADSLASVATSADLVAALQRHLTLDLAMPLEEPVQISLRGMAGAYDSPMPYHFTFSPLGVGYAGDTPLEHFPYAVAVRESHGDDFPPDGDEWEEFGSDGWDEAEAWGRLTEALDVGLPQASREFEPPADGRHLPLHVTGVHIREFTMPDLDTGWQEYGECCADEFKGAILELRPEVHYQSLVTGGGPDVARNLTILVIEIGPAGEA